jgi:hypothetical protein
VGGVAILSYDSLKGEVETVDAEETLEVEEQEKLGLIVSLHVKIMFFF